MNIHINTVTKSQILGILFVATGLLSVLSAADNLEKPNIVFILTDDQRFDAMNAAGSPEIKSPAMDQLATEGTHWGKP
jgi:hypothetical protein